MFKFIERHKIFIILILALITLVTGFCFFGGVEDNKVSDAGSVTAKTLTQNYWINTCSTGTVIVQNGTYKSKDGNTCDTSIGAITIKMYAYNVTNASISGEGTSSIFASSSSNGGFIPVFEYKVTPESGFYCTDLYVYGTGVVTSYSWPSAMTVNISSYKSSSYSSPSGTQYTWNNTALLVPAGGINVNYNYYYQVFACFMPRTYTVKYYSNGGTFSDGSTEISKSNVFVENYAFPTTPTRAGYTFKGWYTSASGSTKADTFLKDTSKTSIYAQWEQSNYTITFDKQGGTGGTSSIIASYGVTCPSISVPSKTGYTFLGYWDSISGGTQYYNSTGAGIRTWDKKSNATLYARWEANTYKVYINVNGGNVSNLNGWSKDSSGIWKSIKYNTTYGTMPTLTKTGYTLISYIYNQATITSNTTMTTASNHTITASWREHTYTIKFNANGGNGTMSNMTGIKYTQSASLSPNTFTKANYLFKGWSLTSGGSVSYYDRESVNRLTAADNGVVNLYAVWEETWANIAIQPSGSGTAAKPYLISTPEELAWIAAKTNSTTSFGGYFKQTANISLSGYTWLPIGDQDSKFIGIYDGNNYVITDIETSNAYSFEVGYLYAFTGLFGNVLQGEIKNINLLSGEVYGSDKVGGIVGYAENAQITSCHSYVYIDAYGYAGGIVGHAAATVISNCYSQADVCAEYEGGIAGYCNGGEIRGCGFVGMLYFNNSATIANAVNGTHITNCFSYTDDEYSFCEGDESVTISDCIFDDYWDKKYYSGTFADWVLVRGDSLEDSHLLPKGLSWLASGAVEPVTISLLSSMGYTPV